MAHPINIGGKSFIRYYAAPLHTLYAMLRVFKADYSSTEAKILE